MRRQPRVLVVEDDRPARRALQILLLDHGYEVECACTLAEGLQRLAWAEVVVLDLMLPDGSGVDLLRRVRSEGRTIDVAVVTGAMDPEPLLGTEELCPNRFFRKPLNIAAFLTWLREAGQPVAAGHSHRSA